MSQHQPTSTASSLFHDLPSVAADASTEPTVADPCCAFTDGITAEFADSLIGMTEDALEAAFARWLAAQGIGR